MIVPSILSSRSSLPVAAESVTKQVGQDPMGGAFRATLASVIGVADDAVTRFFASKPSASQIADQEVQLGLKKEEIVRSLAEAGYGSGDLSVLSSRVESFVTDASNGYTWGVDGRLTSAVGEKNIGSGIADRAMPSASDIKAFYASRPTEIQVTEKVKSLGLSAAQMVQFQATGLGLTVNQMNANVLETMYIDSAKRLGVDIGGGVQGSWTSYFSPTLGRAVTKSEMQEFFANKPDQSQIFQKAALLGLGVGAVDNMMNGLGLANIDSTFGSRNNQMTTSLFQGRNGYSLDQLGRIVAGGGNQFTSNPDGSGSWSPTPAGAKRSNGVA
jgi:hypothetical protein